MFIFSSLTHKNVLQFYGIYTSPENVKYIVTEYLNKGALRDLLLEEYNTIAVSDLISMYKRFFLAFVNCFFRCLDIASGMAYIADCKIVHSDLAARNVLMTVSDNGNCKYLAKIGDLGLGKVVRDDANYYTSNNKSIPVKW